MRAQCRYRTRSLLYGRWHDQGKHKGFLPVPTLTRGRMPLRQCVLCRAAARRTGGGAESPMQDCITRSDVAPCPMQQNVIIYHLAISSPSHSEPNTFQMPKRRVLAGALSMCMCNVPNS